MTVVSATLNHRIAMRCLSDMFRCLSDIFRWLSVAETTVDNEKMELVTNCDRFKSLKNSSVNPYAFTEQGVSGLSGVLKNETAVKSISIKKV